MVFEAITKVSIKQKTCVICISGRGKTCDTNPLSTGSGMVTKDVLFKPSVTATHSLKESDGLLLTK